MASPAHVWRSRASDAEVLAVAASLELSWPYPLPGLPEKVEIAASEVDAAFIDLELRHGEPPMTQRSRDLVFAVSTITQARPRAALYFIGNEGSLTGWAGLYQGREGLHCFELVGIGGAHEFAIGYGSVAADVFLSTVADFMAGVKPSGMDGQVALLIDNQDKEKSRLLNAQSGTVSFIESGFDSTPSSARVWSASDSSALASELIFPNVPELNENEE